MLLTKKELIDLLIQNVAIGRLSFIGVIEFINENKLLAGLNDNELDQITDSIMEMIEVENKW